MSRVSEIIKLLGDDPIGPIELDSPFRMLTAQAVREMSQSGLVEFGAHTHTHPILSRLSTEECKNEIELSIRRVEEITGRVCRFFAYPFGGLEDYSQDAVDILRNLGVRAAVTTLSGPNDRNSPPLELHRYSAGADEEMALFQLKVHHLIHGVRALLH
jgi:peptidoglycan/xylan/chitin deacetylase (PgdA/CDA1 family)